MYVYRFAVLLPTICQVCLRVRQYDSKYVYVANVCASVYACMHECRCCRTYVMWWLFGWAAAGCVHAVGLSAVRRTSTILNGRTIVAMRVLCINGHCVCECFQYNKCIYPLNVWQLFARIILWRNEYTRVARSSFTLCRRWQTVMPLHVAVVATSTIRQITLAHAIGQSFQFKCFQLAIIGDRIADS